MSEEAAQLKNAMQRLEQLTAELTAGNLGLEESLAKYKEAAELAKMYQTKLKEAENEFITIKKELETNE